MGGLDGDTRLEISGCGLNNDVLDRVAAEPQLGTDLPGMVKTGAKVEIAVATVGLSLVAGSVYGHIERRRPAVYARTHAVGEGAVPPHRSHTVAVQGTEVVGGELRHRGGQQARCRFHG
jgi:hypothetical protein